MVLSLSLPPSVQDVAPLVGLTVTTDGCGPGPSYGPGSGLSKTDDAPLEDEGAGPPPAPPPPPYQPYVELAYDEGSVPV